MSKPNKIKTCAELGAIVRSIRKSQQLTLAEVSGVSNLGMRFISELERGKETAELGKVLTLLNNLGIDVIIQPRLYRSIPNSTINNKGK